MSKYIAVVIAEIFFGDESDGEDALLQGETSLSVTREIHNDGRASGQA